MPFRPIQWAKQTVAGRQVEADGSKLVNFYAVALPSPEESKTPVMLYGTPGRRRFVKVPVKTDIDTQKGIHAMLQVDSAIYGQWLFGISSQSQLFRIRLGKIKQNFISKEEKKVGERITQDKVCLLYTSPSPRDS